MAIIATPFSVALIVSLVLAHPLCSEAQDPDCGTVQRGECYNRPKALRLKLVAIATILVASMIGICLPLFTQSVPFLRPDRNFFVIVKAFASGVILSTGFIHLLPESFDMLTSKCLPEEPWQSFSFTSFVAMLSALATLMLDSFMLTFQSRKGRKSRSAEVFDHASPVTGEVSSAAAIEHANGPANSTPTPPSEVGPSPTDASTLMRYRIIAQVLEMGIVVHSVVIGLSVGASQNPCTIRPLIAALCFHQLFEGMGLGGCILQAEYKWKMKAFMAFFFSTTTPFGIALGIALSNTYSDNSPTSLITIGMLNASSAGLLIYMALVDLLAADFLGPRLQGKARLQAWAYVAVLLGAGGMSIIAKWA